LDWTSAGSLVVGAIQCAITIRQHWRPCQRLGMFRASWHRITTSRPETEVARRLGCWSSEAGFFPEDLKKFCTLAKIAVSRNVIPISTEGTPIDSKDGAEREVMFDIEVVAGICPNANIAVYFAQWGEKGRLAALDAAVDQTNSPTVLVEVEQGSLDPALHRLEDRGWLSSEWGVSENNRRAKSYRLTAKGRKELSAAAGRWSRMTRAIWSYFG
jgi:hypothetical protein